MKSAVVRDGWTWQCAALALAVLAASWAPRPAQADFPATMRVFTVAGTGQWGLAAIPGPATLAALGFGGPSGVSALPDGGFLVAGTGGAVVLRVGPDGVVNRVAGTGKERNSGDGGPASVASLEFPFAVRATADGGFLVAEQVGEVRRVSPTGVISRVAGTGKDGDRGDGGPATGAQLGDLSSIAPMPDGGFVVADYEHQRVRRVSADGIISALAGDGHEGFSGDGGPATSARLSLEAGSAVDALPDGGVLIADSGNDRVRRVALDGTITTVAGRGRRTRWKEGAPATSVSVERPAALAADGQGGFIFAEEYFTEVLNYVAADGTIHSVAGDATPSYQSGTLQGRGTGRLNGDGGLARRAAIGGPDPGALAITPGGDVLFMDTGTDTVRLFARPTSTRPAAAVAGVRVAPGLVSVSVRSTVAARARVTLVDRGRVLAAATRDLQAGVTRVPLRGSLGSGVRDIEVIVRPSAAAPILVEDAILLGPLTVRIVRSALRATTQAQHMSTPTHRCRRFGKKRVDCEMGGPAFLGFGGGCDAVNSVVRRPGGTLVARSYSCASQRRPFRLHPRFGPGSITTPVVLFDRATELPRA